MKLFLIVATYSGTGDSLDWFVKAMSPQRAKELWMAQMLDPEGPMYENQEEAEADLEHIFEVPAKPFPGQEGVVPWDSVTDHTGDV